MIEFTVFTPTYNRAHTLINSYKALCNQTTKNFVWLIVDDGSTDNTKDLVKSWQNESIVHIKYVYQENAGKQRAVNTGIENCKTKYFGFLDSDDYYCYDTVEKFIKYLHTIDNNIKVSGVVARRGYSKESPVGSPNIPSGSYIMNFDKLVKKYRFYGDTCRAYKTEILRNYKYPIISDKFIPEPVMLSAIDEKYDLLIVNEVFSITEYLDDGYTKNSRQLFKRNPYGYALGLSQSSVLHRGILRSVKYSIMFTVWCKANNIKHCSKIARNKLIFYLVYPISMVLFILKVPHWFFGEVEG